MNIFKYGQTEINHLKKKDKKLAAAIDKIGIIERAVDTDVFSALVSSIVSQQISNRAAETVWNRLCELLQAVTPQSVQNVCIEDIQKFGMTMRKAMYIKGIGDAVTNKIIDIAEFDTMTDDEIIKQLSALNGVGVWTAERAKGK